MNKILFGLAIVLVVIGGVRLYNRENTVPTAANTNTDKVAATTSEPHNTNASTNEPAQTPRSTSVTIDLSNTGLTKTPMDIFGKINTEELNLSANNLIGSLPAEVRLLQNLKVLNLSNNQFTGVPAEIGQLKNLEVLDLSNNKITGLPNELGQLSNLKVLNLKGNAYSVTDLAGIKSRLPNSVEVIVD